MSSQNPVVSDSDYNGVKIHHEGYAYDSPVQAMVQRAYDIGGIDLVKLIECENGRRDPFAVGDNGHAFGLCQINDYFHKIPQAFFDDRGYQIELCNQKLKQGTKFFGPSRIVKGVKCSEYVTDRFTFTG